MSSTLSSGGYLRAEADMHSTCKVQETAPAQSILPVDPGFSVEAEVRERIVKGEDMAFCFRADPKLLGRAMPATQPQDPAAWQLNYDVFVVCDGHSGTAVCDYSAALLL